MSIVPVTIFSDFTCPFSFVAEAALWARAERGDLDVRFRAYELYPVPEALPAIDVGAWRESLEPLARSLGLELHDPGFRPRTAKAHEAAAHAALRGLEVPVRRAIHRAFWEEGRDIGRIDVLTALAEPMGLDATELKIALDIDLHSEAVLRDAAVARQLRIPGSPTLYVGTGPGARVLVGAPSAAALDEALAGR